MKLIIDIPKEVYKHGTLGLYFDCYSMRLHDTILSGTPIPDNATNGDVIKAMFPNGKVIETGDGDLGYEIFIEDKYSFCSWFDGAWWYVPYQKGGKE